jgi:hypothetical protein
MGCRRFVFGFVATILLGIGVAGCNTAGMPTAPFGGAPSGTVAFERIDGMPEGHFRKLVTNLTEEANSRRIAAVTREGPAQYRLRGYVGAEIRGKQTVIVWVWDVYDGNQQQRLTRLSGEEVADGRHRGWAGADDQVLRRIAHESMDQLASFLVAPPDRVPAPAPASPAGGATIAAATAPETVSVALAR